MSKLNPNDFIRAEMARLFKKHKRLTTRIVVAEAKAQKKLHGEEYGLAKYFTWNVNEGFEKNLLQEAGALIRRINLEVTTFPESVRAWVSLRETPETDHGEFEKSENVYLPMKDVLANKTTRDQIVARALEEAGTWVTKYNSLVDLCKVTQAIEYTRLKILKQ